MRYTTIANAKKVNDTVVKATPLLAEKVQGEYNKALLDAITKNENNPYLTERQQERVNAGKCTAEHYTKNIVAKINKKYIADQIDELNKIFSETREAKSITIRTDWRRGSMGANQCKAFVRVVYNDYSVEEFESERTGGCGYDKESTAIGGALNEIDALRQELCIMDNNAISEGKSRREFIGYGSSSAIVPYFEGGVGFSCHRQILEKLGYTFKHVTWTDKMDVYEFTK